jgi:tetratricopeptide (TPR) repeat protein
LAWGSPISGPCSGRKERDTHLRAVLRVVGELKAAEAGLAEARRLWQSGADPAGILDAGRLFHLEGALRAGSAPIDEALACLDEAAAVGRQPELALIQKGFTLKVMGKYDRAVDALLQAAPRLDRQADPLPGTTGAST